VYDVVVKKFTFAALQMSFLFVSWSWLSLHTFVPCLGCLSNFCVSYWLSLNEKAVPATVKYKHYHSIIPLCQYTFCSPAPSAAVERMFIQSTLFLLPHQAQIIDSVGAGQV